MYNQNSELLLILYGLGLILPIVPSIIILKLFPSDKIKIRGKLTNFTINATGSFAAYIATVLLGLYFIGKLPSIITNLGSTPWNVKAKIQFQDIDGKSIKPALEIINRIRIDYDPPIQQVTQDQLRIKLPELEKNGKLEIGLEGFRSVSTFIDDNTTGFNSKQHEIDIGTIILRQEPSYFPPCGQNAK